MSTVSHAADVDFKFLSSPTCATMSLATEGTATLILHTNSERFLTVVEPTRCSSHRTTNIYMSHSLSQLTCMARIIKCHFLRYHVSSIAEAVC
jgi:hypothetical protein